MVLKNVFLAFFARKNTRSATRFLATYPSCFTQLTCKKHSSIAQNVLRNCFGVIFCFSQHFVTGRKFCEIKGNCNSFQRKFFFWSGNSENKILNSNFKLQSSFVLALLVSRVRCFQISLLVFASLEKNPTNIVQNGRLHKSLTG